MLTYYNGPNSFVRDGYILVTYIDGCMITSYIHACSHFMYVYLLKALVY